MFIGEEQEGISSKKPWDCGERHSPPRSSCRGSTAWQKNSQNNPHNHGLAGETYSHVDVEAEVVGGVEEVIANKVDQGEQDADKENLQSEGDITDKEVEVEEGEEEGHLIDDEECPGDSACQKLWHFHPEPGPSFE